MTYRKNDAIMNVMEPRLYPSCSSFSGMQNKLAAYIAAGYTFVTGPSSGEIDLGTYDIGKYLIVWYTAPTGAIQITANTISAHTASGNGTGMQESVVIFGGILNGTTDWRLKEYIEDVEFDISSGTNFQNILWFDGCWMTFQDLFSSSLTVFRINFDNCIIEAPAASGYGLVFSDCDIRNCKIVQNSSCHIDVQYHGYVTTALFQNNYVLRETTTGSIDFTLKGLYGYSITPANCLFERYSGSIEIDTYTAGYLTNCAFIGGNVTVAGGTSTASVIYEMWVYGNAAKITGNVIIIPMGTNRSGFAIGVPAIDWDVIDFDAFLELTADLKIEYVPEETFYGTGTQNYYSLEFIDADVPDAIKQGFGDNRLWIVEREDFEADLSGKTIYNLAFYGAGGHTTPFDFDADEGFLILAEDSSGNLSVFLWYDSALWPTVYSDVWQSTDYTVLRCFQLWEPETRTDLRNVFRDYLTNKGAENSPMTGSIRFNNLDEEVRIEL